MHFYDVKLKRSAIKVQGPFEFINYDNESKSDLYYKFIKNRI